MHILRTRLMKGIEPMMCCQLLPPRNGRTYSLVLHLAMLLVLLSGSMSVMAVSQRPTDTNSRVASGRLGGVSHVLPKMGQDRPLFVSDNLEALVEGLGVDASNGPVLELMLAQYADSFEDAKAAYIQDVSALKPDPGNSEEVKAKQAAAADELKRIRKDMQQRFRNGEWDGDRARMKMAIDEASQSLVQQVLDLQRAQENAIDYSQMFRSYQEVLERWLERRAAIESEFEDQIAVFLDEEQLARWEAVKRRLVFDNELEHGLLAGESLDLDIALTEAVTDDEERALAADLLSRWRREAGDLLVMRRPDLMDVARRYLQAGEKADPQIWLDAATQEARVRQVLRDHNLSYVQSIADVLSTESSLAFREAVYAEVLSSLYRGARILRSIDAALQQRPLLGQSELEAVKLLRLEASEWMLDRVVDLERSLLEQDMSRLVAGRRTEGQEFFRRGSIPMTDWGRQSAESRQQIRDWDASMMARLQEIIGEVRFTRLPTARMAPSGARDRGSSR